MQKGATQFSSSARVVLSRHDVRNLNVKIFLEALTLLIREWYGYIRHTLATLRNIGGWHDLSRGGGEK